ncbi:MAG TPA: NHL repeat-containing protein [Pyrinomonadaceae bacterium]|jgi:DNA-binding beta-propeller fold protein YncE|nr:NHL repeat-containing protein [Pyrinomonadaceae bacterium]
MFKRLLLALALLLISASVALFIFYRWRDKPTPTVAGWRAVIQTLAGDGAPGVEDAAAPTQARFHNPFGVAVDAQGNVYVADAGESNRIRKIAAENSSVTTLAGGAEGFSDGTGGAASFNTPSALAIDANGNLYVADTSNNRIRKVTPEGAVTTLAGDGTAGSRDGAAGAAQFNAPVGVAVDARGERVYVADTYNDSIRLITTGDNQVTTLAGGSASGDANGASREARFDTPCALVATVDGALFIADTGNRRLRKLSKDGQVWTLNLANADGSPFDEAFEPVGLALTHDNFLYVAERERGRIWQIAPDERTARLIAGNNPAGGSNGEGASSNHSNARFNQPAGIAVDRQGALYVADSANYLVRKLTANESAPATTGSATTTNGAAVNDSRQGATASQGSAGGASASSVVESEALPRLSADALGIKTLPWPLDPQDRWHEVAATLGEVRGSYDSEDSRHHLHSGIDIFGTYGQTVRAVLYEKVESPLANWGHGDLNEGLRVGVMVYVHLRVGRDEKDKLIDEARFTPSRDAEGKLTRVRIKRGTRFHPGDALGTINRMYHVHMNFGAPNAETNPLGLPLAGFTDSVAPKIERDGIQLFDATGTARLTEKRDGRLLVGRGQVRIVVDAYDQVDGNQARRRLGLYKLGYQLLRADGSPAPGFDAPRIGIEFDRMPPDREAVKIAYADESGITVYGSKSTRFLYEATNILRHGRAARSTWDTAELPAGDYTLRIIAADFNGNEATTGRDVAIRIEGK